MRVYSLSFGCVLNFFRGVLMSQHRISLIFTPPTLLVFPLSVNVVWRCTGDLLLALQYDVHNIVARIKNSEPLERNGYLLNAVGVALAALV
jgi:hypothetical protein